MTLPHMTVAAQLAAKLLAHRRTPQDEVADLIRNVHSVITRLSEQNHTVVPPVDVPPRRRVAAPARALRRQPAPAVPAHDAPELPPPPAPKLVRRADVATPAAPPAPAPSAAAGGTVRGIVRWFDPKSGKGSLRLPGVGDVGFDGRLLAESGITRLFKGQEIAATLTSEPGPPQVRRLALPGASAATTIGGGTVRGGRHAKPVLVELKREALRRVAARAEAEHILGSNRPR
jgi:hypothetical protein